MAQEHYAIRSKTGNAGLLAENGEIATMRPNSIARMVLLSGCFISRSYHNEGWLEGVMEDITDRVLAEELRYLSYHDTLTGLYNRAFLEEELERLANEELSVIIGDVMG